MIAGDLDGRVLLVTGGSRGIGRAVVTSAVRRGARVAFCSRRGGEAAAVTLAECEAMAGGGYALAIEADVSREADVDRIFDVMLVEYGHVDAVVNNAGITRDDVLLRLTVEGWDEVIATNLTGPFLVSRRAVREFIASGSGGGIVSMGSLSGNGAASQASYAASKAGLAGLMRAIAEDYGGQGIRAYTMIVGYVETELTEPIPEPAKRYLVDACPLRRSAVPEEIAATALELAFGRTGIANGESVLTSGGHVDIAV